MTQRDDDSLDLSPWEAPAPPRGLTGRVMDTVRANADVEARPSTRPSASLRTNGGSARPRWQGIAAGVVASAAAAAIAWAAWPRPRESGLTSGHVVAAAPSKVTLAGGTVALLGAGADVSWERTRAGIAVTQAAGNVTYQHAGPSRLVISTPFAEVHTASASLNVEVPMSSSKSKVIMAGAAGAGVAAAIIVAVYEGKAEVRQPATSARVVEAGSQVALAAPTTSPGREPFTPVAKATKDRAQRDALAAAIAAARAARTAGAAGAGGGGSLPGGGALGSAPPPAAKIDLTPGELSKEEIRTSVREVLPLLTDCYALVVEKYPTFAGRVTAKLVVEAEPDLGTIVTMRDDSEVDMDVHDAPDAPKVDPRQLRTDVADFNQCLTATLESVVLPPLGDKDGGRVEITYPFVFAPSEEEAENYADPAPPAPPPGPSQKQTPPADTAASSDLTTDELIAEAESAAKTSQWARTAKLAEQVLAKRGIPQATTQRAAVVLALAGCNLKSETRARAGYARVKSAAKNIVRQRCLMHGIELDEEAGEGVMNPFGDVRGDQHPPRPPRAPRPPPAPNPQGDAVLDPFKSR